MKSLVRLAILVLGTISLVSGTCPVGCTCGDTVIICSCQNSGHQNLTLGPFYRLEYTRKIYVHDCEKVRIPKDAFAGLAISTELEVKDIGRIEFEKFAFREMHKYPDQITFMNSGISEIPNATFSGMNNVKHLWFRNVTIGRIHTGGFRLLSNVEYLYFRETTIKTIFSGAFERMSRIQNLYFRKNIKIDHLGDHIFRDSQIDETVFEDAKIGVMNQYALSGGDNFGKMILVQCTIATTSYAEPTRPFQPTRIGQELQMMNVNFSELSLGPYSNWRTIRFEYSRIEQLISSSNGLNNVTTLHFIRTLVNYITERAFERTFNVETIAFEGCAIDTIYSNAFAGASKISTLMFLDTRFIRFQPHAFSNLTLSTFILEESEIETLMHNSMSHMEATSAVKIVHVKAKRIHKHAFRNTRTDYFGMEYSVIQMMDSFALEGLSAELTNISVNTIYNQSALSLVGVTTSSFIFGHNEIPCSCTAQFGSLFELLHSRSTPGWRAERNLCIVSKSNQKVPTIIFKRACIEENVKIPTFEIGYGLLCRNKVIKADCECSDDTDRKGRVQLRHMQQNFPKQISILTISGCDHLQIDAEAFYGLKVLTRLTIQAQDLHIASAAFNGIRNLRILDIQAENLNLLRTQTFKGLLNLEEIIIRDSNINQIHSSAFSFITSQLILFQNSVIKTVASDYIDRGSNVGNLTFHLCDIQVMGSLVGHGRVENVSLIGNTMESILDLSGDEEYSSNSVAAFGGETDYQPNLCAAENEVACYCRNSGYEKILDLNQCARKVENFCVTPDERKKEPAKTFLTSQNMGEASSKALQSKHCKGSPLPASVAGIHSNTLLQNTWLLIVLGFSGLFCGSL